MNDPGCTLMKCTDFKNGVCHYPGGTCKYRQDEIDPETIKDAERFQWLINRGVAWRGCYDGVWRQGEWLYSFQNARDIIDNWKR